MDQKYFNILIYLSHSGLFSNDFVQHIDICCLVEILYNFSRKKASWSLAVCVVLEIDAILFVLFSGPMIYYAKHDYHFVQLIIIITIIMGTIFMRCLNILSYSWFIYAKTSYNIFIIHNSNIFSKERKWLLGLNLDKFS